MRSILKYIILSLILLIPFKLNASSISLSCPSKGNAGESVTCKVNITTSGNMIGVKANYSFSNGLTYKSMTPLISNVSVNNTQASGFALGTSVDNPMPSGTIPLGNLVVSIPSNATPNDTYTITIDNVNFSNTSYEDEFPSGTSATIGVNSNVDTLDALSVTGANINFSKDVLTYNVIVDAPSTKIEATPTDSKSTIIGTGDVSLNYGLNSFSVVVTSEAGTTKSYTINITRPEPVVETPPTPSTGNNNNSNNNNNNNNNTTPVTPEKKSTNNKLKELKVNDNVIELNDALEYTVSIPYEKDSIDVSYLVEDEKSTARIEGNTTNLQVGENIVSVIVVAESGSTRTYTLKIQRLDMGVTLSNNNYLSSLEIENYKIDFNKDTLRYVLKTNDKKLNISALAEDEKAVVSITGNKNLSNNSEITIKVTAEDGTIRNYVLVIKTSNIYVYVMILAVSVIVLVISVIAFLMIKKKNKGFK